MRVLSVVNWLDRGGIEVQLLRALPGLRRRGIEMDVCRLAEGPLDAEFSAAGCTLWPMPKSANCYVTARAFQNVLAARKYDLVHCNLGYISGGFALGAARAGVPIVVSIHSAGATSLYRRRKTPLVGSLRAAWLGWHRKLMDRHASVFAAPSKAALDAFYGRWRDEPGRYRVVPNGVAFPGEIPSKTAARRSLGLSGSTLVLLHVGSFRAEKNHAGLLRVLQNVVRRRPDALLLLVGDGPLRATVERESRRLGLRARIRLEGSQRDPSPYYAAADVLVFPSTAEGFGNVLVEAQGSGLPIVASDIPAHHESVAPAERRFLFPVADHDLAAELVLEQADSARDYRNPWVPAAQVHARKHFSIERFAGNLATLYGELTGDGKRRAESGKRTSVSAFRLPLSAVRRPRLLHLTTIPATQWVLLRGQNAYMHERGFEVHAVSSPGDYLTRLAARDPVTVHAVPISRRIALLRDVSSLIRLYCLLRRIQPDIVHLSTPKAALLGALAACVAGVPVRLFHMRGLFSEGADGWKGRVFGLLERLTARLCHSTLCNAFSLVDYARRQRILRPGEGKVLANGMANGIDPARFDPDMPPAKSGESEKGRGGEREMERTGERDLGRYSAAFSPSPLLPFSPSPFIPHPSSLIRPLVIGYVGRLTRDKGLEELAAAWTVVREEFPDTLLLLVGPDERERPISPAARAVFETDPRVILTGVQDEVAPYYRAMHLFVFPSHREGFPNAPMEAAAMGLPVIVTRVVGNVDAVVDGVTGIVVPPKDPAALAEAMRRYLRDPDLRARHGAAGRRRVLADFRPEAIWDALLRQYERLLQTKHRPLPLPVAQPSSAEVMPPTHKRAAA